MAHIETGGRGRSPNFDLNLVPFIDLMSVLITFLLISAVWTQVSMIQLGASFAAIKDDSPDIKVPPLEDLVLKLELKPSGYILYVGKDVRSIPLVNNEYDKATLLADLSKIKEMYPDKEGIYLSVDESIIYDHVITLMDVGLKAGFIPQLTVGGPK